MRTIVSVSIASILILCLVAIASARTRPPADRRTDSAASATARPASVPALERSLGEDLAAAARDLAVAREQFQAVRLEWEEHCLEDVCPEVRADVEEAGRRLSSAVRAWLRSRARAHQAQALAAGGVAGQLAAYLTEAGVDAASAALVRACAAELRGAHDLLAALAEHCPYVDGCSAPGTSRDVRQLRATATAIARAERLAARLGRTAVVESLGAIVKAADAVWQSAPAVEAVIRTIGGREVWVTDRIVSAHRLALPPAATTAGELSGSNQP